MEDLGILWRILWRWDATQLKPALQKVISSKMTENEYGQLADFTDVHHPQERG